LGADGISPTHNYNHNNNSNQFFSVQTDITSSTAELASSNQQTLVIFKVSFIGHPALHRVAISKIHEGTVFWFFLSLRCWGKKQQKKNDMAKVSRIRDSPKVLPQQTN